MVTAFVSYIIQNSIIFEPSRKKCFYRNYEYKKLLSKYNKRCKNSFTFLIHLRERMFAEFFFIVLFYIHLFLSSSSLSLS